MFFLKKNNIKEIFIFLNRFWIQIFLIILALWDLRYEMRLLFEHFTFISLFFTVYKHPLAIAVLLLAPGFRIRIFK